MDHQQAAELVLTRLAARHGVYVPLICAYHEKCGRGGLLFVLPSIAEALSFQPGDPSAEDHCWVQPDQIIESTGHVLLPDATEQLRGYDMQRQGVLCVAVRSNTQRGELYFYAWCVLNFTRSQRRQGSAGVPPTCVVQRKDLVNRCCNPLCAAVGTSSPVCLEIEFALSRTERRSSVANGQGAI